MKSQASDPWQCLYLLPEPHGHRSFRRKFLQVVRSCGLLECSCNIETAFKDEPSWCGFDPGLS